jgi:hypothetical protein
VRTEAASAADMLSRGLSVIESVPPRGILVVPPLSGRDNREC